MIVFRDSARKGKLNGRVLLFGFGFAVLIYAIGLPTGLLYIKHPQYKPLFIAAIVVEGILLIAFFIFGTRWYRRVSKTQAQLPDPPDPPAPKQHS